MGWQCNESKIFTALLFIKSINGCATQNWLRGSFITITINFNLSRERNRIDVTILAHFLVAMWMK